MLKGTDRGAHIGKRRLRIAILFSIVLLVAIGRTTLTSLSLYRSTLLEGKYLDLLPEPKSSDRIVIFAPHEDDELLGTGCYIQRAVNAGAHVRVVLMTNGEYPEIPVMLFEKTVSAKPGQYISYGYLRQGESKKALLMMGVDAAHITFLGYPDHTLDKLISASNWLPEDALLSSRTRSLFSPYDNSYTPSAPHCGQSVLKDVLGILAEEKPNIVIAVHPYDVHPDHWATHAFVRLALSRLEAEGAPFAAGARLINYLVHRTDWPYAKGKKLSYSLLPPKGFMSTSGTGWYALPASIAEVLFKYRCLLVYKSQESGWSALLSSFVRSNELFGEVAPVTWEISAGDNSKALLEEVVADSTVTSKNPNADIKSCRLYYKDGLLTAEIETVAIPSSTAAFELEIIDVGINPGAPRVLNLTGSLKGVTGSYAGSDGRISYKTGEIGYSVSGNKAVMSLPWQPVSNAGAFIIWFRSYIGLRNIDQSLMQCVKYTLKSL